MNEVAYEMRDGEAVRCHYYGSVRRREIQPAPMLVRPLPSPWTKRETRQRARQGRRCGLRLWPSGAKPRRYDGPVHPFALSLRHVAEWAHQLRDPNDPYDTTRFFLYLPASEPLTEVHIAAVERAWRR